MKRFIEKYPYIIFWLSIPGLILLTSFFPKRAIDFPIHDTYFVIASIHVAMFISLILGIIGLIYFILRNYRLINWMKLVHVCYTIIPILVLMVVSFYPKETTLNDFREFRSEITILSVLKLLLFVSQIVFILNIGIGLVRGKMKENEFV